jgi:hypothetical protein
LIFPPGQDIFGYVICLQGDIEEAKRSLGCFAVSSLLRLAFIPA